MNVKATMAAYFRDFSAAAVEKFGRGEALTELEQMVVYEQLKVDELSHAARWARAAEDFQDLRKRPVLPPSAEAIKGDWMSCWEVDSSREYMCISATDPENTRLLDVFTRTMTVGPVRDFTTRSPFGDFCLLKDARVRDVVFVKDDLLDGWTSIWINRIDETGHVHGLTSLSTSYVADATVAARMVVSRTPPEWGGQRWSLNPFTHELSIFADEVSTEPLLRTKNMVIANREALRRRDDLATRGMWSALAFLMDHPDYFPKVPGVSYATFTLQRMWAPPYMYTNAGAVSAKSVPAVYARGVVTVPALFGGDRSERSTGWYAAPNGISVFVDASVRVFPYRDTVDFIQHAAGDEFVVRVRDGVSAYQFEFDSEDARGDFVTAYVTNAREYLGLDVYVSNVVRGG